MVTKRCGYCGTPLDGNCNPLSIDKCNSLTEDQLNNAELDHGNCCIEEEEEDNSFVITRDMAIDAQDMSLEGQIWKWR